MFGGGDGTLNEEAWTRAYPLRGKTTKVSVE